MELELRDGVLYYAGTNVAPDLSAWAHKSEETQP